jgi:hypothetical protein
VSTFTINQKIIGVFERFAMSARGLNSQTYNISLQTNLSTNFRIFWKIVPNILQLTYHPKKSSDSRNFATFEPQSQLKLAQK